MTTTKRRRTGSNLLTIASRLACMQQAGGRFDEQEYRRLLAMMVVEINTAFQTVQGDSFRNLMRYCNGLVPIVSCSRFYRHIYKLPYRRLCKGVCQWLQLYVSEGAWINLTIHQQKHYLRLMRRRCVLMSTTSFLRPVRPERPELRCSLLWILSYLGTLRCIQTQLHPASTSRWRQMSPCLIPESRRTPPSDPWWGYRKCHQLQLSVG